MKIFSVILICCLGILVYSDSFHGLFQLDDLYFILNNPSIRNVHDLPGIWHYSPGRFLTFLSLALNYHFHQYDVYGYHLFNVGIHLLSAVLVWWLVLLTLSTPALKDAPIAGHRDLIALLAGLVFVSHPVQTEAVTYIWQRAASMAAMFYLASLCLYVKSRLLSSRLYYACCLIAATAAMFTKENAITLPLTVLLYEFTFLKNGKNIDWKYLGPVLLTIFIIPLTMFLTKSVDFQGMHLADQGPIYISPLHYLLTEFRVMMTYVRLAFLPVNQNLDYDYHVSQSILEWPTLTGLLFLSVILWGAKRLSSKYRLVAFSVFWFFLTLSSESSFIPFNDVIFEHRLYLPIAGYALFLVSGLYYLVGKKDIKIMAAILLLVIGCNSILTYQRNNIWKDGISLWSDATQKSPHKARGYNNLGQAYLEQGNFTQALKDLNKAVELDPHGQEAYNNRGLAYDEQGNWRQALTDYNKAIALNPGFAESYNNRGLLYYAQDDLARALKNFNKAIELNPLFDKAYDNRGVIYQKQGDLSRALADFNKALALDPGLIKVYVNRGVINEDHGDLPQAFSDYNKAIALDPRYAEVYVDRGLAYALQNDLNSAINDYSKAIALNPNLAAAYSNRANAYNKQGRFTEALTDCSKAIKIDPWFASTYYNRAVSYYQLKEYAEAWHDVNKIKTLGSTVDPVLINALKEASPTGQ